MSTHCPDGRLPGSCPRCGVRFTASDGWVALAGDLLRAHVLLCDGGDRADLTLAVVDPVAATSAADPFAEAMAAAVAVEAGAPRPEAATDLPAPALPRGRV